MRWKIQDAGVLAALAALGSFIWIRDGRWWDNAGDTLPLLLALPLFVWLRAPWRFRPDATVLFARGPLLSAALCVALGVAGDITFLLSAGWVLLLWSWMSARLVDARPRETKRLLVLPLLAFPWIANDLPQLGWWFRLSGASGASALLSAVDLNVVRHGTFLVVNGFSANVEPACSGLNGLQAMLVAGTMVAFVRLRQTRLFWGVLPLFVLAAWAANVLRIAGAASLGAKLPPEKATAWVEQIHVAGGWVALVAMFALGVWITALAEKWSRREIAWAGGPWLELAVIAFAGWRCRDLFSAWFNAPFDRGGWTAFALWLLPLAWQRRKGGLRFGANETPAWLVALALVLICAASLAELNVLAHAGFALLWTAFMPRGTRLVALLTAIAWWPALGWIGSRMGWSVSTVLIWRLGLALGGAWWIARTSIRRAKGELEYAGGDALVSRDVA